MSRSFRIACLLVTAFALGGPALAQPYPAKPVRFVGIVSDAFTAIVESAVRRFRPITLTAAAAVLALIPLVGEVFWAPMALAMMAV